MREPGTIFPPRDAWDVAAYDDDECTAGYLECRPDEPEPGDNRSPSYRWGWRNRLFDQGFDDGLRAIRIDYIRLSRRPN